MQTFLSYNFYVCSLDALLIRFHLESQKMSIMIKTNSPRLKKEGPDPFETGSPGCRSSHPDPYIRMDFTYGSVCSIARLLDVKRS